LGSAVPVGRFLCASEFMAAADAPETAWIRGF
jgi:hypothetical protein